MAALEFCLPPAALPRLMREPALGGRSGRTTATELVWHDTGTGSLAAERLSLCEAGGRWRLERLAPRGGEVWSPGVPAPCIAEAEGPGQLGLDDKPLAPVAGFRGELREVRLSVDPATSLQVWHGSIRGVAQEQPVCRFVLDGPPAVLMALSTEWAASLPLTVPHRSLAMQALTLVRAGNLPPTRAGSPEVPPGLNVADAFALVVGHLTETILAAAPVAAEAASPEPVHVLRVAVRRLRSATSVFRRAVDTPALGELRSGLGKLAQVLGPARDWDVFLGGVARDLAAAMPDDRRIAAVTAGGARQRTAAYDALRHEFASTGFRRLTVALVQTAALQPWRSDLDEEGAARLDADASVFASETLARQHRRLLAPGDDITGLSTEDLHALRKQGKRMRYTAEFFAPLYGSRRTARFLRRLANLQEALGHLNDAAVAAELMGHLSGGAGRAFATGAVQGFLAARGGDSRHAIAKSWRRVQRAKPFWL